MSDLTVFVAPADLGDCAREPIHIPGSIQPHGYLIVLNEADLTLAAISQNAADALGVAPAALIGQPVADLFVSSTPEVLETALKSQKGDVAVRVRFRHVSLPGDWDGRIHQGDGLTLLELKPRIPVARAESLFGEVRFAIERIRKSETAESACERLASEIRQLTGFERVMIYRFDADWNGEVIAEDRSPESSSYRGHAFPESDIPAQARALYARNPVRLIPDARYIPSPIVPAVHPSTGQPIDLSAVTLRSVSPVHLEYLANMGVAASMSVSIVRDGRLWGLVACHHSSPRVLSYGVLEGCEVLAQALGWYLDARERNAAGACVAAVRRLEGELKTQAGYERDYRARLELVAPALLALTGSQGLAICYDRESWTVGRVPADEQIAALAQWLSARDEVRITTDRLPDLWPAGGRGVGAASGIAAVKLADGWLIWFRAEWRHTLTWAGEPGKSQRAEAIGSRISPRQSFASWRQRVRGRSRPWTLPDLFAVDEAQMLVVRTMMEDQMRRLVASEDALRTAKTKAEEESRAKSQFLANMSHELRTPLNAIIGFSDLIKSDVRGGATPKIIEYATDVNDSGWYLLELVNDILDLSKVEAGKYILDTEPLDPGDVIGEAIRVLSLKLHQAEIRFYGPDLKHLPILVADRRALKQILVNLLSNAVKFTPKGGRVDLTVDPIDGGLRMTVTDTGIGMSKEVLSRIGRPFEQADDGFGRQTEGTGLGLALTKSLVELHAGTMEINSVQGSGTSVSVTFPAGG